MAILMTVTTPPALPICPDSPNCVSSQAVDDHAIAPLLYTGDPRTAFERLRTLLMQRSDVKIISADESSVNVEFRTLLGFVDDGLFLLDSTNSRIHIRSASRSGYWDLGKNRSRIEDIRKAFEQ
ncbi:MAG TPA: DUF1499 domain-containing protein [Desulfuromonadales bacterium]|nr:DUF1499 domain-containing protein [Desulfuromonadales bacterium]